MAANALDAIMLFGDSLTQRGWEPGGIAQRLAYVYARRLDVINRGMGGYNAEWGIPVFEQVFAKREQQAFVPQVKLLTIWFGANDSVLDFRSQHTPLPRFVENLTTLITMVTSPQSAWYSPQTRIILISAPPFSPIARGKILAERVPPERLDRDFETTRRYAQAVVELAGEKGLPVVDMWSLIWKKAGEKVEGLVNFLNDGLHLTDEAYEILFEELMKVISTHYPELHYSNLPDVFAHWEQVDSNELRRSLQSRRIDV